MLAPSFYSLSTSHQPCLGRFSRGFWGTMTTWLTFSGVGGSALPHSLIFEEPGKSGQRYSTR